MNISHTQQALRSRPLAQAPLKNHSGAEQASFESDSVTFSEDKASFGETVENVVHTGMMGVLGATPGLGYLFSTGSRDNPGPFMSQDDGYLAACAAKGLNALGSMSLLLGVVSGQPGLQNVGFGLLAGAGVSLATASVQYNKSFQ